MEHFSWQGIDQNGIRINGNCAAPDKTAVLEDLRKKSITPLKIQNKFQLFRRKKTIKSQDIIDFSRQLTTLIDAGVTLTTALQIIAQGYENFAMKHLILNIKNSIEAGHSFQEALTNYPKYFDSLYCNLIAIGEYSGTLSSMLQQLTQYQEKILQLTNKIKKALIYPSAVILTALIITSIMLVFVIPQFKTMFQEFGAALPIYTQIVISISEKLKSYWFYVLILFIGIFFLLKWFKKDPRYANRIDKTILQLPIIGKIIAKSILARFTRTLAITFNAGIPLAETLKMTANSSNNSIYADAILQIHSQVISGQTIAIAMQNTALFPGRMTQMIAIAEESGTMPLVLNKLAEYYEAEVDAAVENFLKLLEPLLMIVLGIVIGGLVIAMYLPIFRIGTAI